LIAKLADKGKNVKILTEEEILEQEKKEIER